MDKHLQKGFWSNFKSLFSYFNLTKEKRSQALKPIDIYTWIINGFSEFLGSCFISLGLVFLSLNINHQSLEYKVFLNPVLSGLFVGFCVVGIAILVFSRWSCDLNPIVSLTRYLKGQNNGWYTSYKIFAQAAGSLLAVAFLFGISKGISRDSALTPYNFPIDVFPISNTFIGNPIDSENMNATIGILVVIFVEILIFLVILFGYFYSRSSEKYRNFLIIFATITGYWLSSVSTRSLNVPLTINPIISTTQNVLYLSYWIDNKITSDALKGTTYFIFSANGSSIATVAIWLSSAITPFVYVFLQGLFNVFLGPICTKCITYKNNAEENLIQDNDQVS